MEDGKKKAEAPQADELLQDVARLYSWANIESNSYRSFSRKRAFQPNAEGAQELGQEMEGSGANAGIGPGVGAGSADRRNLETNRKLPKANIPIAFQVARAPEPSQPVNPTGSTSPETPLLEEEPPSNQEAGRKP